MKKPNLVYVVFGATGEYSDHSEWPVKAYFDREQAQAKVVACTRRAKSWEAVKRRDPNAYEIPEAYKSEDKNLRMDYTGTNYYVVEVEVA